MVSLFANEHESYGMYLYLPREYYRDILIYTVSGDVTLGDVDSEKITTVTNSGDITSENTRSLCSFSTASGNILLDFYSVITGSVALDFETDIGELRTDLISGSFPGSYMYSFNGGGKLIHASLESGILTVRERTD